MSRGVKDLRELINVSRLTHRPDDDDPVSPDSDGEGQEPSRLSSASSAHPSSDSGIAGSPHDPSEPTASPTRRRARRRQLPPLQHQKEAGAVAAGGGSAVVPAIKQSFDNMMEDIDSLSVTDWLERANVFAHELGLWCNEGVNFCAFADFWLNSCPEEKKKEMVELEVSVLNDEVAFAFRDGQESGRVSRDDVQALIQALLHEYPERLLGPDSSFFFLDYLDVLSCERTTDYRLLLTDVHLSTRNRLFAQWYLSIRSFALLNIWSAVVGFFRELTSRGNLAPVRPKTARPSDNPISDVKSIRFIQAVSHGFVKVIDYYILTKKINPSKFRDEKGRNLVFLAVSVQQPAVLNHLLTKYGKHLDVNCPSETGNTPLHAAVSCANIDLVRILIEANADINAANPLSDGSTPLHLAVIYGHSMIASYLLEKGADASITSNGISAEEMAKEFEQTYIHELITRFARCDLESK